MIDVSVMNVISYFTRIGEKKKLTIDKLRYFFGCTLSVSYNMTLLVHYIADKKTKCVSVREMVNALVGRWSFDATAISKKNTGPGRQPRDEPEDPDGEDRIRPYVVIDFTLSLRPPMLRGKCCTFMEYFAAVIMLNLFWSCGLSVRRLLISL